MEQNLHTIIITENLFIITTLLFEELLALHSFSDKVNVYALRLVKPPHKLYTI